MAKQQRSFLTFLIMIVGFILSALLLFYLITPKPKRENFEETHPSSRQNMIRATSADNADNLFINYNADSPDQNELLYGMKCFQFPNLTVQQFKCHTVGCGTKVQLPTGYDVGIYEDMLVVELELISFSFKDIQSRIICKVNEMYEKIMCKPNKVRNCQGSVKSAERSETKLWEQLMKGKIADESTSKLVNPAVSCSTKTSLDGPIYVLITQAPYYRDGVGKEKKEVIAQYNTAQMNKRKPYITDPVGDSDEGKHPLYYYIQIIFASYNKKLKNIYKNEETVQGTMTTKGMKRVLNNWNRKYFSSGQLCFINVPEPDGFPTFGGCAWTGILSKKSEKSDQSGQVPPYQATCLGPASNASLTVPSDSQKVPSTFVTMYMLNPKYNQIACLFNANSTCSLGQTPPPKGGKPK